MPASKKRKDNQYGRFSPTLASLDLYHPADLRAQGEIRMMATLPVAIHLSRLITPPVLDQKYLEGTTQLTENTPDGNPSWATRCSPSVGSLLQNLIECLVHYHDLPTPPFFSPSPSLFYSFYECTSQTILSSRGSPLINPAIQSYFPFQRSQVVYAQSPVVHLEMDKASHYKIEV